MKVIWLAGGCFWGVEAYFGQLKGVLGTRVGYGQGKLINPTYQQVCDGITGHAEVCEVTYDEEKLALPELLEHFFRIIDPTTLNRQGPDRGSQYRTGVYYREQTERLVIVDFIDSKQALYTKPIVVEVEEYRNFYPAEEYHQKYLEKNPGGYCHINLGLATAPERK